jgi:methionyl-tRNA formyltransferase
MRVIFFGTPYYVVPILNKLHKTFKSKSGESPIICVVTQKPKPVGRKKVIEYSPVDRWAYEKDIKILRDLDIKEFPDADIGIVASFGVIIPKFVIDHFKFGILNIHPSLLPKYRGASPVPATLIAGDKDTGVTIIKMDEKMDHGPVVGKFKEEVLDDDTTETLRNRLFELSADYLVKLIPAYIQGKIKPKPQNHKKATFTRQITKQNAFIPPKYLRHTLQGLPLKGEWNVPFIKDYTLYPKPSTLYRFIRAMQEWPIAWSRVKILGYKDIRILRLKLLKAHLSKVNSQMSLVLDKVQLEAKNPVSWKQFTEGYPNWKFTN